MILSTAHKTAVLAAIMWESLHLCAAGGLWMLAAAFGILQP